MDLLTSFGRLKGALKKTKEKLGGGLLTIFKGKNILDDELAEELERRLIMADVNVSIVEDIIEKLRKGHFKSESELIDGLKDILLQYFDERSEPFNVSSTPYIILIVGVNGTGKTTTIAKLAHWFKRSGKKVILGAADTFRAASQEQLAIWAERVDVPFVGGKMGADPASVAFDTVSKAISRGYDIVIIDTAGRIHTRKNLMDELSKISRVLAKLVPEAPHEVILTIDATTGQNAINQARVFSKSTKLTGIILTKLDTSAKGGSLFSIKGELHLPIKMVGIGEKVEDIVIFNPHEFVDELIKSN